MNRIATYASTAAIVGLAGYYLYSTQMGVASGNDVNIDIGAIDTTAADAACTGQGHARLVCLADGLKKSATPELLARLELPYSVDEAKKWSNFPPVGYRDRVGPTLEELSVEQRGYVKAMLKEASGIEANEGMDEMVQILNADDYLKAKADDGAGFSSGNFHVAFIGTPAATGTWQLYFGGHHLAFANTYVDGKLTGATPSFRGVEPFTTFNQNGRDNAPMAQEQVAFAAMLTALSPDEAAKAKLPQIYTNIIVGPQQDDSFPSVREGVPAGELDDAKQALVMAAIATYVRDVDPADADAILARYQQEMAETFVSFSGTPEMATENDYVRIDGPSVWIEYSIQPGRSIPGNHPHSVWRDRVADYGGNK